MNKETADGLYTDPMIYDILYTPDTWREMNTLEIIEREFARRSNRPLDPNRLWLEPACGSGRYLRLAAARGRRTAGFDLDEGMIRYAGNRKRPEKSRPPLLFQADMADFQNAATSVGLRPGSVDFAFTPVNSLRHLTSDKDVLSHLDQMATLLRPGAVYVVGLSLTDYECLLPEEDLWVGTRGRCRVTQLVNYLPPKADTKLVRAEQVEQVISHLTIERPGRTEHLDDTYDLRCYDLRQWQILVRKSALEWGGSFDARGRQAPDIPLAYQLEVLVKPQTKNP